MDIQTTLKGNFQLGKLKDIVVNRTDAIWYANISD